MVDRYSFKSGGNNGMNNLFDRKKVIVRRPHWIVSQVVSHINFKLSFVLSCCDCLYKIKTLKLFETITYQIYIICTSFVIYFTSVISQHSRTIQFLKWSKTCLHKAFPITTTKANAYCCIRWKQLSTFIVLRDIDLDFTTVWTIFVLQIHSHMGHSVSNQPNLLLDHARFVKL